VDPVDHGAATEAGGAEQAVGQVARGAADDGGERQGHGAARGAQQQRHGDGEDRNGDERDDQRVAGPDAEAGAGVTHQPERDLPAAVAVRVRGQHRRLGCLVGRQHQGRDAGNGEAGAARPEHDGIHATTVRSPAVGCVTWCARP
jgi:hypothetical protein